MNKDKQFKTNKTNITLQRQQWVKPISLKFAIRMALANPNSPMKKSYDNTYHCNNIKIYDGEKIKATYCKNRWCLTCNRIRTAINILNYSQPISEMGSPFFVTLTLPTVGTEELRERMSQMEQAWRTIYKRSKDKKIQAFKDGLLLKGIRKVECTLRPDGKFHYHFHFILDGWNNAEWLRGMWLKTFPKASPLAQDVRPADKGAMMELMKYATKMSVKTLSETDFQKMDTVFQAFKGKRTLSTFGGLKSKKVSEEDFTIESQIDEDLQLRLGNTESVWKWNQDIFDWVNPETGELLIGEDLPEKIKKIVEKI